MNDLNRVADLLAKPDPSEAVIAEGRARLGAEMNPQRTRRWHIMLLPTAAAASVAAVVLGVSLTSAPDLQAPAVQKPTGRQILLEAADAAAKQPERTGKYWYWKFDIRIAAVRDGKETVETPRPEYWTDKTGTSWWRNQGPIKPNGHKKKGFLLWDMWVPYLELTKLPTSVRPLLDRIEATFEPGATYAGGTDAPITGALMTMLYENPVPPKVRATVYRALAQKARPEYVGPSKDSRGRPGMGVHLVINAQPTTWIIDLKTGRLLEMRDDRSDVIRENRRTIDAEWRNTRPMEG